MEPYLITYDLLQPGRDYYSLHSAIRRLDNDAWHELESVWIIESNLSARQIVSYLQGYVDGNDRLLVVRTGGIWSSNNLPNVQELLRVTHTVAA